MNKKNDFIILDFGSQYTNLIKSGLSKMGYSAVIIPGDERYEQFVQSNSDITIAGVILSGGA